MLKTLDVNYKNNMHEIRGEEGCIFVEFAWWLVVLTDSSVIWFLINCYAPISFLFGVRKIWLQRFSCKHIYLKIFIFTIIKK